MDAPIDAELRRFILISVPSVPYLEALLLLRENANRGWTPTDLARRLYLNEDIAMKLLNDLRSAGIASPGEAGFIFQPTTPELRHMLDRLAAAYAQNLIEVTNLIHSYIDKKAQQFADAFKWRQDS